MMNDGPMERANAVAIQVQQAAHPTAPFNERVNTMQEECMQANG